MSDMEAMIGKRFGRLVVIAKLPSKGHGTGSKEICKCDCGKQTEVYTSNLKRGHTTRR